MGQMIYCPNPGTVGGQEDTLIVALGLLASTGACDHCREK